MRDAGLQRTATCRVTRGIDEATGEALAARVLTERVAFLAALVAECGQRVLDAHWDGVSVEMLCTSRAPDGSLLPLQGYKAAAKLWGPAPLPAGVKASSRVGWMGAELAARQLRSAAHRLRTCAVLLAGGLPADCPDVVSGTAMRRRIGRRLDHGDGLPASLFALEPEAPRVPALVPLAVADQQLFTAVAADAEQAAHAALDAGLAGRTQHKAAQQGYARRKQAGVLEADEQPPRRRPTPRQAGAVLVVRLLLPLLARPATATDWSWHRLTVPVPARCQVGVCSPPTLRVTDTATARADVTVTLPAPRPLLGDDERPARVLSVDWGVRRLLSATVVRAVGHPGEDGRGQAAAVDGRPLYVQAGVLQGRARRAGVHRARVQAKADHYQRLAGGLAAHDPRRTGLAALLARAHTELADLQAAQTNLNDQIARLAARWLVEQALAAGCQAIALEDLKTLEHRGLGRRTNERCSLALRGKVAASTRQAACAVGLGVVTVTARGTSALCPRCGHRLRHLRAPGSKAGHAWAWCPACGHSADRDHAAAENVGQRAIAPTAPTVRHKPTRRAGLHPATRTRRGPTPTQAKRRPTPTRPPRTTHHRAALLGPGVGGQAGPAASRPVIPPPNPAGEGHRSAGPGPRRARQAGRMSKMRAAVPPTRLDGLLAAYRTTLRATPILYRAAPWSSAPSGRKKA